MSEGWRQIPEGGKSFPLCTTELLASKILVHDKGFHNSLHAHGKEDGQYIVLGGRVTFYGEGDKVIADLGPYEGVFIPRGTKYWFESTGNAPLELLRVSTPVAVGADPPRQPQAVSSLPRRDGGS
jgi:mannose-6-phosphate isomerase-like protein (cupin superfamily)